MKIIVTGARGFIGSNAIASLSQDGHEVIGLVRSQPAISSINAEWIVADLSARDWNPTASLPEAMDAVIHLAQSKVYRDFPETAPDIFEVNTAATLKLLDYARQAGARHFIYASSGSVYTGRKETTLSERIAISPEDFSSNGLGFYCASKLCGEILVECYRTQIESVSSIRIFAPYGPGGDASLINRLVERVSVGERVQIQGNPGLTFNPIHVEDIVKVISSILRSDHSIGTINVAGREVVSLTDIVNLAGELSGREALIDYSLAEPPEGARLIAETGRMETIFEEPLLPMRDGIAKLLKNPRWSRLQA